METAQKRARGALPPGTLEAPYFSFWASNFPLPLYLRLKVQPLVVLTSCMERGVYSNAHIICKGWHTTQCITPKAQEPSRYNQRNQSRISLCSADWQKHTCKFIRDFLTYWKRKRVQDQVQLKFAMTRTRFVSQTSHRYKVSAKENSLRKSTMIMRKAKM